MKNNRPTWQKVRSASRRCALVGLVSLAASVVFFLAARRAYPVAPGWVAVTIVALIGLIALFFALAVLLFFVQVAMRVFSGKSGGGGDVAEAAARASQISGVRKLALRIIYAWFALGAAASVGFWLYDTYAPKKCDDAACFVAAANECREAEFYHLDDARTFWKFNVPAGCGRFEKTLVNVGADEPAWMEKMLEGKSLVCDYARSGFDERWVESAVFGIEGCRGELKEALGQLLFLSL